MSPIGHASIMNMTNDGKAHMDVERINAVEIETDEELGGNGYVRINAEDLGGIEHTFRVDIRWVCIADAVAAIERTDVRHELIEGAGDADGNIPDGVSDILITRNTVDNKIDFCALAGSHQWAFMAGGE